jgi:anaerobic selenocysteine-containing dehydrogenase
VGGNTSSPPAFWWYWHAGYRERWNTPGWGDDSLPRKFDDYFNEAMAKGWWDGLNRHGPDDPPQVMIESSGDMLRRSRGGKKAWLTTAWPKMKMIVTLDFRLSETCINGDYFLPAAQHYEKLAFGMPTPHVMNLTLGDKAAEPPGEAKENGTSLADPPEDGRGCASAASQNTWLRTAWPRNYAELCAYSMKLLQPQRHALRRVDPRRRARGPSDGHDPQSMREKGPRFVNWA